MNTFAGVIYLGICEYVLQHMIQIQKVLYTSDSGIMYTVLDCLETIRKPLYIHVYKCHGKPKLHQSIQGPLTTSTDHRYSTKSCGQTFCTSWTMNYRSLTERERMFYDFQTFALPRFCTRSYQALADGNIYSLF